MCCVAISNSVFLTLYYSYIKKINLTVIAKTFHNYEKYLLFRYFVSIVWHRLSNTSST